MSGCYLTSYDWFLIGFHFEGFCYGVYSAIFAMYVQHHWQSPKKSADKRTTVFYSLCTVYVLSLALFAADIAPFIGDTYRITFFIGSIITGCCDFIGQFILVYRCWIVWNRNIRVMIIPAILTIIFLVLWVMNIGSARYFVSKEEYLLPDWGYLLSLTSITISLVVNALVMGLILFKICKVYLGVKPSYGQNFGTTGGNKLRPLIFILLESGMLLFAVQLAWLVFTMIQTQTAHTALQPIIGIQHMLNGLTPTIIQVRASMGLSFHDEESLVEVTSGLRFGSVNDHQNSIPEMRDCINIGHQEERDNNFGVQECNKIDYEESGRAGIRANFDTVEVQRKARISWPPP